MNKDYFLTKFQHSDEKISEAGLTWELLEEIYFQYLELGEQLESAALTVVERLQKLSPVHSIRFRIKNPERLIDKIIRNRFHPEKKEFYEDITPDNFTEIVTDLVGVRILHLFKDDWPLIHDFILKTWDLLRSPYVKHRPGDKHLERYEAAGCQLQSHQAGYRSVHYILMPDPASIPRFVELQVRTLYEEAWSEIDHTMRYSAAKDDPMLNRYLDILNQLSGSADEMGSFIRQLHRQTDSVTVTPDTARIKRIDAATQKIDQASAQLLNLNNSTPEEKAQLQALLLELRHDLSDLR